MPTADEMLTAIDAAILAILNGNAVVSYAIGDRRVDHVSIADLRTLRRDYLAGKIPTGGLRTYVEHQDPGGSEGWET